MASGCSPTVAAQRALALSLELPLDKADERDAPLADLLADARHTYPEPESRLRCALEAAPASCR